MQITLPAVLSALTAIISAVFSVIVLWRWYEKRRLGRQAPHLLAWGIGLSLYFAGALCQTLLKFTWNDVLFALWYWTGALAVAPWLGQGTVYLLVRRGSIARNLQMVLLLISAMTLPWALFLTPLNSEAWRPGIDLVTIINDVMQRGGVRGFSPIMNLWGTVALVGGAIYSAWLFRRKQIMRNRVIGNWFIAAGGIFPAFGGTLIRLGVPELKYAGELLGVVLIFIGFWLATNIPDDAPATRRGAAASASSAGD
ncbi:MAG: hypothetical protein NZM00_04575 [Anaerolinea sp.]|nr:hypothetical protein [Anaerolinea sp.]